MSHERHAPNTVVMREMRLTAESLLQWAESKEKRGDKTQASYLRERAAWCVAAAENIEQLLLLEANMGRIADDLKFYKDARDKALADLATAQAAASTAQTALDAANAQITTLTAQVPDATDTAALDAADAERNAATPPPVNPAP